MTAFLIKSGVKEVLPALREAAMRKVDIKILTDDYLSIPQPDADDGKWGTSFPAYNHIEKLLSRLFVISRTIISI
ncbi:hypothetical protein MKY34_15975 [Sporosarcina sp. FSL K6-1522]|uniref:hypothetical protein n=1 Tax=Sporosarcina sp. FSL K6-1522 TaxID=2921554 RepID=UPI00315A691C